MASVDGIDTIEFESAVSRKTVDSQSHATKSTSDDGEYNLKHTDRNILVKNIYNPFAKKSIGFPTREYWCNSSFFPSSQNKIILPESIQKHWAQLSCGLQSSSALREDRIRCIIKSVHARIRLFLLCAKSIHGSMSHKHTKHIGGHQPISVLAMNLFISKSEYILVMNR